MTQTETKTTWITDANGNRAARFYDTDADALADMRKLAETSAK